MSFPVTDSGISESSEPPSSMLDSTTSQATLPSLALAATNSSNSQCSSSSGASQVGAANSTATGTVPGGIELGHSRNSSNTSQVRRRLAKRISTMRPTHLDVTFFSTLRCPKDPVTAVSPTVSTRGKAPRATPDIKGKSVHPPNLPFAQLQHDSNNNERHLLCVTLESPSFFISSTLSY